MINADSTEKSIIKIKGAAEVDNKNPTKKAPPAPKLICMNPDKPAAVPILFGSAPIAAAFPAGRHKPFPVAIIPIPKNKILGVKKSLRNVINRNCFY